MVKVLHSALQVVNQDIQDNMEQQDKQEPQVESHHQHQVELPQAIPDYQAAVRAAAILQDQFQEALQAPLEHQDTEDQPTHQGPLGPLEPQELQEAQELKDRPLHHTLDMGKNDHYDEK